MRAQTAPTNGIDGKKIAKFVKKLPASRTFQRICLGEELGWIFQTCRSNIDLRFALYHRFSLLPETGCIYSRPFVGHASLVLELVWGSNDGHERSSEYFVKT